MAEIYKLGDLVWAKMKGFSPWPGKIVLPKDNVKKPSKKHCHFVFFFGSENYAFIERGNMKSYFQYKSKLTKTNKTAPFREAIEAIEKHIIENDITVPDAKDLNTSNHSENSTPIGTPKSANTSKSSSTPKSVKKEKDTPKKRPLTDSSSGSIKRSKTVKQKGSSRSSGSPAIHKPKARLSSFLDRNVHIERPETPPLDIGSVSQTLKDKKIEPSKQKFGFLGLGIMGSGMVKNLLNSGHNVMVWNRSSEKCLDFVKAGAKECLTPSDVIAGADVTFSCVSDPQVAKNMVFGNCGVLQEVNADKSYIEMTGIDAETSQDLAEAINNRGGRYLEAQVQGSKVQAEEGTLVILAAGDRSLFDDCQSCFQAMGKNSFYLGEVGNASKMNLVLQVTAGVTLAGLAEGMALADRAGLQQKDVLEIMELTALACPLMIEKGKAMIEGGFPPHLPLQHMQKDLRLGMLMGDALELPLALVAATNEAFKHAKRLGYGEHDVSSVYIRTRY